MKSNDQDGEEEEEEDDENDDLDDVGIDLGAFANGQIRSQYVRVWGSWDTVRTLLTVLLHQQIKSFCINFIHQRHL